MRLLFLDTNIVIDLLARRAPFYDDAALLFTLANKNKVMLSVNALTFATANNVLMKELSPQSSRKILRDLSILVNVIALDEKIIALSLNDKEFSDIEDAMQYYSALVHDQDMIITRDLKGFKMSQIPVMSPGQFLASLESQ